MAISRQAQRTAVLLINLGTPDAPTAAAVKPYLKQFLSDPRVVEIPKFIWWFILNLIILPIRSGASAKKYASVWMSGPEGGAPLLVHSKNTARALEQKFITQGKDVLVDIAMRYGNPSMESVLKKLEAQGMERLLILPLYPQYSATTTASTFDEVFRIVSGWRNQPELRLIKHYHDHQGYIEARAASVRAHWAEHGRPDKLVMSFHGVPKRTLLLGDPYHCECYKTARLVAGQLGLSKDDYLVTFQSRFGKAEWLQPYTAPTLKKLAEEGVGRVDVMCPGFTSDCLETLEEISMEAREDFLAAGGSAFHYIPCLNEDPQWIEAMASVVEQHLGAGQRPLRLRFSKRGSLMQILAESGHLP